jgi:hypothetical protein
MKSTHTPHQTQTKSHLIIVAGGAPALPTVTQAIVEWLETTIRKPLEGTLFDTWVAAPAKEYYITAKRRD